jgi:5-oxoprolinase (ATP-hydrolysing)
MYPVHIMWGSCRGRVAELIRTEHERQVGDIARKVGFTQISLSSDLSPAIKALPRGNSAVIDAYLSPVLRAYVDGFNSHFADNKAGKRSEFMKSDGGLVSSDKWVIWPHRVLRLSPPG